MASLPPPLLDMVCNYVREETKSMFIFLDKKATITFYRPWKTLVYVQGDFSSDDEDELLEELHRATASSQN